MKEDNHSRINHYLNRENILEVLRNPLAGPKFLISFVKTEYLKKISDNYTDFYLRSTKDNVFENPERSVGPENLFERMREWQLEFLKEEGLQPSDQIFDIGCGVLRGGLRFVEYLEEGNYYGADISKDALLVGYGELLEEELTHKKPVLINNSSLKFNDAQLQEKSFDYIWAQSVFTHLPPDQLEECLSNINRILKDDGVFFASYFENTESDEVLESHRGVDFSYSFDTLEEYASSHGLRIEKVDANHPNGELEVAKLTIK